MGLMAAGMISGAGSALQQVGLQAQKGMQEKELQQERIKAEELRDQRLAEARRGEHSETLLASKELHQEDIKHAEAMEDRREAHAQRLYDQGFIERNKEYQLKLSDQKIKQETHGMKKDELKPLQAADGTMHMINYKGEDYGPIMDKETKTPLKFPKDISASSVALIATENKMIDSIMDRMAKTLYDPSQRKRDEAKIQQHYDNIQRLGGRVPAETVAKGPTPPFTVAAAAAAKKNEVPTGAINSTTTPGGSVDFAGAQ